MDIGSISSNSDKQYAHFIRSPEPSSLIEQCSSQVSLLWKRNFVTNDWKVFVKTEKVDKFGYDWVSNFLVPRHLKKYLFSLMLVTGNSNCTAILKYRKIVCFPGNLQ